MNDIRTEASLAAITAAEVLPPTGSGKTAHGAPKARFENFRQPDKHAQSIKLVFLFLVRRLDRRNKDRRHAVDSGDQYTVSRLKPGVIVVRHRNQRRTTDSSPRVGRLPI